MNNDVCMEGPRRDSHERMEMSEEGLKLLAGAQSLIDRQKAFVPVNQAYTRPSAAIKKTSLQ